MEARKKNRAPEAQLGYPSLSVEGDEMRFGPEGQPFAARALDTWSGAAREEGTRARELHRRGVEEALVALGQGFLAHPENEALRADLQRGALSLKNYFNQLLRLVYRLMFLLTVEERNLLHPDGTTDAAKALYAERYGLRRLRERSVERRPDDRLSDLWEAMKTVFRGAAAGEPRLGLPALAGIFAQRQCPALDGGKLENHAFLLAVFKLGWLREDARLARVNWRDMGPEELGSVYECLLDLVPQLTDDGRQFVFATRGATRGNARKTTGSYYTPDSLVQALLDSALEPVIADALAKNPDKPVEALLRLAIVDPACGSGHILLAAARRLALHVARIEGNGTPSAADYRRALRQVVGRCIYGVDLDPMAVALCKVSLWMEAVEPGLPLTFLDAHIQHGDALLGATPELMGKGIPDAAWEPIEGDDKKTAGELKKRNKRGAERPRALAEGDGIVGAAEHQQQKLVADAWCAAFVWPKQPGALADAAPTNDLWREIRDGRGPAPPPTAKAVEELAERYRFFHWHLQFPSVFAKGGFDVVLGNPPWIAHAGRAAQPLPGGVKQFFACNYEAFADYPTTHGLFASVVPGYLRHGGYLGLIVPSSLSELDGYAPTRSAHDRRCEFVGELVDFGEGRFPGVTQPCMALVSRRAEAGRKDAAQGDPWPMARPELTATDRQLLARLASLPTLPAELFGERGVQSDKSLAEHFIASSEPVGRFTTPIREGTDVREFELLRPRYHVDPKGLDGRMRSAAEFGAVRVVIRQTARYPIAAISDGTAFRNSLLAGLDHPMWPPDALVALLNSALIRWAHYMRFRDARQPVMPQLKIGHLRAIPVPLAGFVGERLAELASLGKRLSGLRGGPEASAMREALDRLVADAYQLTPGEVATVLRWHERMGPTGKLAADRGPERLSAAAVDSSAAAVDSSGAAVDSSAAAVERRRGRPKQNRRAR